MTGVRTIVSRRKNYMPTVFFSLVLVYAVSLSIYVFAFGGGKEYVREAPKTVSDKETQSFRRVEIPDDSLDYYIPAETKNIVSDNLIIIDPGHGGIDDGTVHFGISEKDINLEIALKLKAYLDAGGFDAYLLRDTDFALNKEDRAETANNLGAAMYVSIHQNGFDDTSTNGIEVWHNGAGAQNLAAYIYESLLEETGAKGRGAHENMDYLVLNRTTMPACIVETGFLSNPDENKLLQSEEYQQKIALSIYKGIEKYINPKSVYLSFDDGPNEKLTNKILDILAENGIKATFFLVGENVARYPETAKRIAAEGHTIGIHCYSHDYSLLYSSPEAYVEDFKRAYDIVYETTGVESQIYRFPGGSINAYNKSIYEEIIRIMAGEGFEYYDWNADCGDTHKEKTVETIVENASKATGYKNVFLLMHDIVAETAEALPDVIRAYDGFMFRTIGENTAAVRFK